MPQQPRYPSRRTLAPQSAPPGLYASTYTPERGAAVCRRLAAGESLRSICRDDPSMPTEKTVWNWSRAHRDFRLMKAHALATARERSLAERDAALAAKRAAAGPFGGPRGRTGRPSGYGQAIADQVIARVMGEGLTQACQAPDMPSVGTVYNWLKRHPDFLERYRQAKAKAPDIMLSEACADLPWQGSYRKSMAELSRTARRAEKAAARISLKRYAPRTGPRTLEVRLEESDGTSSVIYRG
jgi:hypothetical protein